VFNNDDDDDDDDDDSAAIATTPFPFSIVASNPKSRQMEHTATILFANVFILPVVLV